MQTKDMKYKSFLRPDDKPAIWLNKKIMETVPAANEGVCTTTRVKYDTYLEQLGIKYPTVK